MGSKEPRTQRLGTLTIRVGASQASVVLELAGELDLASAELLEAEIRAAETSEAPSIVVDLSALNFVDSRGLEVLVRAHQRADADHQRFEVRGANGPVAHVLEVTGLIGFLG